MIAAEYAQRIEAYKKEMPDAKTKFILYTPIDAENIKEDFVKPVDAVFDAIITYTEYGEHQLIESGANLNKVFSIPHGVEFNTFKRMDKVKVKKAMKMKEDDFVVLNVSRNQPRKRLDLFFYILQSLLSDTIFLRMFGCTTTAHFGTMVLILFSGVSIWVLRTD